MSYQANNNPGMQGGYFQTPNDFRAQNQVYASSGMQAPGSGYGAAQRVAGGSQGLGSRQGQAPGQGYVQVPNNLQAQNQGYAPGMQAPGSYTSPTGGGVGGGRGDPQGYGQEFASQGVVGSGQGYAQGGVGPQSAVGSDQRYGQGLGPAQAAAAAAAAAGAPGYAQEVGRGGQGYGRGGGMQGVGAQQGMQGGGGISNNAVVGPQYCLPQVSSFAVSRKGMSMSGGDWEIKDATGRTVFKVSGSVVTVRDKKFLKDPANTTLLRMQKKLMSLHDTWQIYLATDTLLATVRRASMVQWKTAMDVYLGSSSNSHNPDYVIRGDYFEKNVNIYQGAQQAALVTRQDTFADIFRDRDNFGVTIYAGIDIALIFALIVIMDEIYINENLELAFGAPWNTGVV